ncbi:MAG: N-acetylglucosamine-6-phosphate deacetylase [Spirochaetaceae bacterium]|jgi:N-acetylglucosamine-6-phosphate deacetylase|nr:N-acetylglucosamine-6-phosphate deacetylase [Spirochaetaceae bacterium]
MGICLYNGTLLNGSSALKQCAVLINGSKIEDVFSQKRFEQKNFSNDVRLIDVNGAFIAPGFIDTHIHGCGGYGTEDCSTDSILEISRRLAQCGVSAFNPTIYPSGEENMIQAIRAIVDAMGKESGARIMGIHMEGPFLSPEKAGVQRPETIKAVDIELFERLWAAAEGHIVNMTVAPEIKRMHELALVCRKKGVVLQAGHTNALYSNMVEGIQAGIMHATHLFNAMRQMNHHDPGAAGAVLIHYDMSCELIADGVHIHPDLVKLLMRVKPMSKIVLVTDSLKPTGQREGPFIANGEQVKHSGGCFCRVSDGVIAGSALTMIRGVQNLVQCDFPLVDAVRCATINPAQVMGYSSKGQLTPGYDADITVFDDNFRIMHTIISGNLIQ